MLNIITQNFYEYRYGFNGMEKDDEVKGNGSSYDFKFRIYDPRLGRFLSIDPLMAQYPMLTPYQFAANSPIQYFDLEGLEAAKRSYSFKERKENFGHIDNVFVYDNPEWVGINTAGSVFFIHKNDQGEWIKEQIIKGDPSAQTTTVIKGGPNAGWAVNKSKVIPVGIGFSRNSNTLSKATLSELLKVAKILKNDPGQVIKIVGQSTLKGKIGASTIDGVTIKDVTATQLADARAAAIQAALVKMGVDPSQVMVEDSKTGADSTGTSATIHEEDTSNYPEGEITEID